MLILVRHGRTAANASGRMQGRVDNPLDEVGLAQAEAVTAAVTPVTRVITSPLQRASATAGAIAERSGVAAEPDDRWIELDFGVYDGRVLDDVPTEVWASWQDDASWAPPGGESLADLRARTSEACDELVDAIVEHDVVVVSHVSPIKAAVGWALGLDHQTTWRTHLDVASVSRIAVREGRPMLVSFNEVHHLSPPEHRMWWLEHRRPPRA